MKTIKLILEDMRNTNSDPSGAFRVKKATNTVEFKIGEYMSFAVAKTIIEKPGYTVDIIAKS